MEICFVLLLPSHFHGGELVPCFAPYYRIIYRMELLRLDLLRLQTMAGIFVWCRCVSRCLCLFHYKFMKTKFKGKLNDREIILRWSKNSNNGLGKRADVHLNAGIGFSHSVCCYCFALRHRRRYYYYYTCLSWHLGALSLLHWIAGICHRFWLFPLFIAFFNGPPFKGNCTLNRSDEISTQADK